eukprot:CAMPEP_0115854366 /NCGR_PEP_ID=MMETSP0287-20121206/13988_1 /TAXON_ID=412157 /ORGANISM="Chrysochromulina rotalis, Strain UIO044" /LENGTH=275 /DNA_ID=CAMNT_0003308483 /DNA_START=38 /DNA_END=865 /DNA_ORIENTATION=+
MAFSGGRTSCFFLASSIFQTIAGMAILLPTRPMSAFRTSVSMQYTGYDAGYDQQSYGGAQQSDQQQSYGHQGYGNDHVHGDQVLWRVVAGCSGVTGFNFYDERDELVYRGLPYKLKNGDVQVLSRWNMRRQKLTVSRVQCIVQIHDGTATLTSCGKGPTLWRGYGQDWVALGDGDQVPLTTGDQVSLDCTDPEAAVFTCLDESLTQDSSHQQPASCHQPGLAQQGQPDLWYPWERLFDANGAVYYSNALTGVAQWEPPVCDEFMQQGSYQQPGGY